MQDKVKGPAIGLIVTAVLGVIGALWNIGSGILQAGAEVSSEVPEWMAATMNGTMGIILGVIGLGVSGFIFWGALQMKNLQSWGMAMAASIVAMVPFLSPCCCVGLPIGIWAVIVLMKDEVKQAFPGGSA